MLLKRQEAGQLAERISSVLLLLLSFWVLCYRLDALPMFLWDESRQANNALEMLDSGNIWYTTYDGEPDFWNTKPHLLILFQCAFMKMLGPGLLALRLPSAIAGCLIIWVGFDFLRKRYGFSPAAAWIAVMLGCGGFNSYHIVRTGDYDALLTLFIFLATLSWLKYLENPGAGKYLNYAAAWFTVALLTKGIAAAMWLPCWFVMGYVIKPRAELTLRRLILLSLVPLFSITIYYVLHEWQTPGYLHAVIENEFSGRYLRPNEGHDSLWYYYAEVIWNKYFIGFIVLVPIAWFFLKTKSITHLYLRILACVLVFIFIISLSATRIYWYLAPALPLLALLIILPLCQNDNTIFQIIGKLIIIILMISGYFENFHNNTYATGVSPAAVLLQAEKTGKLPFNAKWHVGNYYPVEKYYAAVLSRKTLNVRINKHLQYNAHDTIIVGAMDHLDILNRKYYMRQHHYPTEKMPVWVMVVDSAKRN